MRTPKPIEVMDSLVAPALIILGLIFFGYIGWIIFQ